MPVTHVDPTPTDPTDRHLHALLQRSGSSLPIHIARARLLGTLASAEDRRLSLQAYAELCGDCRPTQPPAAARQPSTASVESIAEQLAQSVAAGKSFRLYPVAAKATRASLAHLALVRREEIDAFVDGLFGSCDYIDIDRSAERALDTMAQIRALLQQLRKHLDDPVKPASSRGLIKSLRSVEKLMQPLEAAMNAIVAQCQGQARTAPKHPPVHQQRRTLH